MRAIDSLFASTPESKQLSEVLRTALGETRRSKVINQHLNKYKFDNDDDFSKTPTEHGAQVLKTLNELAEAIEAKDCGTYKQMHRLFDRLTACAQYVGTTIKEMASSEDGEDPDELKVLVLCKKPGNGEKVPTMEEIRETYLKDAEVADFDIVHGMQFEDLSKASRKIDRDFYLQVFTQIPIEHSGVKNIIEECRESGVS